MADPNESPLLKEAAEQIRSKDFQQALDILIPFLGENPDSERAWLLLSYCVKDPQRKIASLQKVLELNPTNQKAKERLSKWTQDARTRKGGTPQSNGQGQVFSPPRFRKIPWYTYPVVAIIILMIGFISLREIIPSFLSEESSSQNQVSDQVAVRTSTQPPTETKQPAQTSTTSPADIPSSSPSPTHLSPIPTRDLAPPQGVLAQQMDDVQNQVATLRELAILLDNPRYLIPQNKVYSLVSKIFRDHSQKEDVKDQAIVLRSLGLIDSTYDLYSHMLESLDEGLGGFYIPWSDELFVIGEGFSPIEKFIYAHEYTHALTDQHFHLEDISVYPICKFESDQCSAVTALVEGDATDLMYRWLESYASEEEITAIEDAQFIPIDKVISSNDFPPPYQIRDLYFRYSDGRNFVKYLFEIGGWDMVDQAYQVLPATTEQILHPDKYLSHEPPLKVELVSISDFLDETWEHLATGTIGELMTEMILGYSENYLVQIDQTKAAAAASGWGGDQYHLYYQSRTLQVLLVIMWEWDTIEDRIEFWEAITDHLNLKYLGKQVQETGDTCWTKINDHFSCIYEWKKKVLWITAPTMSLTSQILAEYPNFK